MENVTEPKSPEGKKLPQTQPKSPMKEKVTCMGCNKKFQLLLSHLERTKSCQDFYDMTAMREEAERLTKEKKAQRSREQYQNPEESTKKRAAARHYYELHTPEKRATMALYNESHRKDINEAKREEYQSDPDKKQAKRDYYKETRSQYGRQKCTDCDQVCFTPQHMKRHIDHNHSTGENFVTCQICDKNLVNNQNLERHLTEVHGGIKHRCEKCPAAFIRASDLQAHIKEGWHYLSFHCKQCKKTIVFKNFKSLIDHTIVKQSEGQDIGADGTKWKTYKSGILVTCKSHVESTQLKDGERVLCMPRKDKVKAA